MKSILLVVLFAAAATAAVIGNEVADVVKMPDVAGKDEMADSDIYEMPQVIVIDVDELIDAGELTDEAEESQTALTSRHNLMQEEIGAARNTLVYDRSFSVSGIAGARQTREVTVSTNRIISAVLVWRVGADQGATSSIIAGGAGRSFVTVRLRSAVGRGYHYRIQVFVR